MHEVGELEPPRCMLSGVRLGSVDVDTQHVVVGQSPFDEHQLGLVEHELSPALYGDAARKREGAGRGASLGCTVRRFHRHWYQGTSSSGAGHLPTKDGGFPERGCDI